MVGSCGGRRALRPLLVLAIVTSAGAQTPQAPTVFFPTAGVPLNPTVFFSAYAQTGGDLRDHQRDFEVQIADAGSDNACQATDFDGSPLEYRTLNASGNPPDCLAGEPRCHGAGMAHMVTSTGAYPGVFGGDDAGQRALDPGNTYCLRVRVMGFSPDEPRGLGWSAFSAILRFDTVVYDGRNRYVSTAGSDQSGSNSCLSPSTPCATLGRALTAAQPGDTILVRSGVYPMSRNAIALNNVTDRLHIRGTDLQWNVDPADSARPVLQANFTSAVNGEMMQMSGMTDTVIEDIIISGNPNCVDCDAWPGTPWVYIFSMFSAVRTSIINVDFLYNVTVISGPATDLLLWDIFQEGVPPYTNLRGDPEEKRTASVGIGTSSGSGSDARRVTVKGLVNDNCQHSLSFDGPSNIDLLVEETELYRSEGHVFRPDGLNRRHTIRRSIVGDGLEGAYYEAGVTSIHEFVAENNAFYNGLVLCDNGNRGPIDYLVLMNNVMGGHESPSGRDGLLTQNSQCGFNGAGGNILDGSDRVFLGFNSLWWTRSDLGIVSWDCESTACTQGIRYSRCAGGPGTGNDYRAWEARPDVAGSPVVPGVLCLDGDIDSPDPMLARALNNQPTLGRIDPTPLPGSPLIDAGAPGYIVPPGGGARVDIGAIEVAVAPVVTLVAPTELAECAPEGTTTLQFEVTDTDGVDPASIAVEVRIDGNVVPSSFSVLGGGGQVTLDVTVAGGLPASSLGTVEIRVADAAVPPNGTVATFPLQTAPPSPTGVQAQ